MKSIDDDPADVAQAQLPRHLAGRLEVRVDDGLLEVRLPDALAGVDVDDRHRLGPLDEQVAAARAARPSCRAPCGSARRSGAPRTRAACRCASVTFWREVGRDLADVAHDLVVDPLRVGDEPLNSSSVNRSRTTRTVSSGSSYRTVGALPFFARFWMSSQISEQTPQVGLQGLLGGTFGGGADDHAVLRRLHPLQHRLQALARVVAEAAADALQVLVRREHEVAAREAEVRGEPGALAAHRVLRDLDHHGLARLQQLLDPAAPAPRCPRGRS